jgi:hypothetical protein
MKIGEIWANKIHSQDLIKILYIECDEVDNYHYYLGYEHVNPVSDCDPIEHMVLREWFLENYVQVRNENVL